MYLHLCSLHMLSDRGRRMHTANWCGLGTQRAWPLTLPLFSGLEQINSFLPTPDSSSVRWDYNTIRQSRCNMVRMHAKLLSCVWLFETLWTVALQAPLSMGFSRQEYWNGLPCPPPGDLPNTGVKPTSLTSPELAGRFFTTGDTWEQPITCSFV